MPRTVHVRLFLFTVAFCVECNVWQDEAEGGADGSSSGVGNDDDKRDVKKQPSNTPLFDDEMVDTKANVKEKAEELRKQGC